MEWIFQRRMQVNVIAVKMIESEHIRTSSARTNTRSRCASHCSAWKKLLPYCTRMLVKLRWNSKHRTLRALRALSCALRRTSSSSPTSISKSSITTPSIWTHKSSNPSTSCFLFFSVLNYTFNYTSTVTNSFSFLFTSIWNVMLYFHSRCSLYYHFKISGCSGNSLES